MRGLTQPAKKVSLALLVTQRTVSTVRTEGKDFRLSFLLHRVVCTKHQPLYLELQNIE